MPYLTSAASDPFGESWKMLQTGKSLLAANFPVTVRTPGFKIIQDRPDPTKIVYESKVSELRRIPDAQVAETICSKFELIRLSAEEAPETQSRSRDVDDMDSNNNTPWGVYIPRVGYFSPGSVRALTTVIKRIPDITNFILKLKKMMKWLNAVVAVDDPIFASWFQSVLLNEPGIMVKVFDKALPINTALDCMMETYLTDEVVRVMLENFSSHYGVNNRYLFIPPHVLELWRYHRGDVLSKWMSDEVHSGVIEKAFGLIHMPNHWGALQVDFRKRRILFGDSLSVPIPLIYINAVRVWLRNIGFDLKQWEVKVGVFKVSQQPPGSGSCAVNALNAIEHCINNSIEYWTHERSAYHRVRLLKVMTGFSQVIFCP